MISGCLDELWQSVSMGAIRLPLRAKRFWVEKLEEKPDIRGRCPARPKKGLAGLVSLYYGPRVRMTWNYREEEREKRGEGREMMSLACVVRR